MRTATISNDPSTEKISFKFLLIFKVMSYGHEYNHPKLKMESVPMETAKMFDEWMSADGQKRLECH